MQPPEWLNAWQANWGQVMRTPLETQRGVFKSEATALWKELGLDERSTARASLKVYHRQYWIRFFKVMQSDYPLCAGLMGYWNFNLMVQEFLAKEAPRGPISRLDEGFEDFVRTAMDPGIETNACLLQAVQWDRARKLCLASPASEAWSPAGVHGEASWASLNFNPTPDWHIVSEDWRLLDLLLSLSGQPPHAALPYPERWSQRRYYLVQRQALGLIYRPLTPPQAALYKSLRNSLLLAALDELARTFGGEADLAAGVRRWMQESIAWKLWKAPTTSLT